jgi:hypothetical protein
VYSLCALLGPYDHLSRRLAPYSNARLVELQGGLGLVPLSEDLLREVQHVTRDASESSAICETFEFLTPAVELWVCDLSRNAKVAFVETEYFSGEGFERAALWQDGELVLGPLDGAGAVNEALRALGVSAGPGQEEFDYVGLGRHRSLEEWLSEA